MRSDDSTREPDPAPNGWNPSALDGLPAREAAAAVRADQRRRWRVGQRVPLETYLAFGRTSLTNWEEIAARVRGNAHARRVQFGRAIDRVAREMNLDGDED